MDQKEILEEEIEDIDSVQDDTQDEESSFGYDITSYGADYTTEVIVNKMKKGDIFVPLFQRQYVWSITQASRFIESLLLGLPVPGIFLSKQGDSEKLMIIDGQQRVKTLEFFYDKLFHGKKFVLKNVQPQFRDKTYDDLTDDERRRLDGSIIHATIVKQDRPSDDQSSIYYIFERLNTGGTILHPQEIRACIFAGKFNDLLKTLNDLSEWREIFGPVNKRMKDRELILRFFALFYDHSKYKKPFKEFLNRFMKDNRDVSTQDKKEFSEIFSETIRKIFLALGPRAFRIDGGRINAAFFESIMIGVATQIKHGNNLPVEIIEKAYANLLNDDDFIAACKTGTSDEKKVNLRVSRGISAFEIR